MLKDDILKGETARMEFKLRPSETFLKTVVAFANCGGGKILFAYLRYAETWGFGLPKVFSRIVDAGLPMPEIVDWGNAIRIIVRRRAGSQKGSQKKGVDAQQRIIALMKADSAISTQQIADELKVTRRTVAKQILGLKAAGTIRRIGPDRGGHWEVVQFGDGISAANR